MSRSDFLLYLAFVIAGAITLAIIVWGFMAAFSIGLPVVLVWLVFSAFIVWGLVDAWVD